MMSVKRKICALVVIFSLIILYGEALPKKRVCVIGAGRAGLAAIKVVASELKDFKLIAFERNSDVGGLWIYRESPDLDEHGLPLHTGIYKNLRTNLPKYTMVYPDFPNIGGSSYYASHETFLGYLRNYTDHFELRQYIQFNTLVTNVTLIEANSSDSKTETWRVETKNLNTNVSDDTICDAVMVCNGYFSKPNIPKIPGLETFPGQVLHSIAYRRPENYTNQTVLVLGAGASGLDIARDLSTFAKIVYHSHKYDYLLYELLFKENVKVVRRVVAAIGSVLILKDSTKITDVDTFIFCTGYVYDSPFLDESSGITYDTSGIRPLYRDFINIKHPSMAFIGMIIEIDFGDLCYSQTSTFLRTLLGKEEVPSFEEMLDDFDDTGTWLH